MNRQATASPAQLSAKPIIQQKVSCVSQPSTSGSIAGPSNSSMYKVRVPRNLAKKYSTMRFQSTKVDISSISKAQMTRQSDQVEEKDGENLPSFGAGSEFGRERREEARKKRRGFVTETKDPDSAPWNLKIGGKSGRRFTGRREAGINENSSYYILTQCEDGAFEAVPVDTWFNFTADIKYKTLTVDEAEEEYNRREKIVNYFSVMVKKRLQDNKEEDEGEDKTLDKKSKIASKTSSLIIHDDELDLSMSEEEGNDDDDDNQTRDKNNDGKRGKKDKQNAGQKQKPKKNESDAESDMSSEEDGYMDSKEMDYLSDSSSSSEENAKVVEVSKPKAEDDLNAEETSSEDDDELTQAGHELKDMLAREEGRESFDEEDEDPDQDEVKGTSALFLQGDKKRKKKSGSGSSTSSNSRSSTPTAALDGAANTIAAAVSKLSQERPGTPSKVKKRPANAAKKGTAGEEGSPAAKKPRVSPAPSSVGTGGGSRTSTPTPTGTEDGPQGITEEAVRRYLTRKPMTSKDLLQKFKSKRTGLTNDETVKKIAAIVRKLQPEQKTIKGKLYLSLKQTN